VEGSNNTIQDNARAAQMGASLGEEMHVIRSQREVSLEACAELTKKNSLLEEELRFLKGKLHRLTQEKLKVERDSRAAISLARSLDMHTSSDAEFYKRKVDELKDRLNSEQAVATEYKVQLEEMRRKMERSFSQNRLSQLRREE